MKNEKNDDPNNGGGKKEIVHIDETSEEIRKIEDKMENVKVEVEFEDDDIKNLR